MDDDLYEAINWCVLNQVKFTQDPTEYHNRVLLVLMEDWRSPIHCTDQVVKAQRKGKPVYGLNLRDGKVVRHE